MDGHKSIAFFILVIAVVNAWPTMQNMNNQQVQGQSWPWMPNNEAEKSFEMPKSMAYPIPSNGPNFDGGSNQPQNSFPNDMWSPNFQDPMAQSNSGPDDFPYNRPYRNTAGQGQPYPMPSMHMGMHSGGGMPPPPHHRGGGFGGMNQRVGGRSTNSPSEFAPPQTSPFDFLAPRYPIEYSPSKSNGSGVPAITIHYNVTYTFGPFGWKPIDVAVDNADFHASISQKAIDIGSSPLTTPGGGIVPVPQNEMKSPGVANSWWWPKKTGSEIDDTATPGFGAMPQMSHGELPQGGQ
jgi:hypothetical protein